MDATDALDGADLAFLKDRAQSQPFWDHAEGTLSTVLEVTSSVEPSASRTAAPREPHMMAMAA